MSNISTIFKIYIYLIIIVQIEIKLYTYYGSYTISNIIVIIFFSRYKFFNFASELLQAAFGHLFLCTSFPSPLRNIYLHAYISMYIHTCIYIIFSLFPLYIFVYILSRVDNDRCFKEMDRSLHTGNTDRAVTDDPLVLPLATVDIFLESRSFHHHHHNYNTLHTIPDKEKRFCFARVFRSKL